MSLLSLLTKRVQDAEPDSADLQDVLLDMSRYGQVRLGQYGSGPGWTCTMEVSVTPVGAKFEVRSEYVTQNSPIQAALECRERLLAAVKALGGAA